MFKKGGSDESQRVWFKHHIGTKAYFSHVMLGNRALSLHRCVSFLLVSEHSALKLFVPSEKRFTTFLKASTLLKIRIFRLLEIEVSG